MNVVAGVIVGACIWMAGDYSKDNFTYGTTPFASWVRLVDGSPAVRRAAALCHPAATSESRTRSFLTTPTSNDRNNNDGLHHGDNDDDSDGGGANCTVFGSSTGLLAFYVALYNGLRTVVAWEILPCLVATARECTGVARAAVRQCRRAGALLSGDNINSGRVVAADDDDSGGGGGDDDDDKSQQKKQHDDDDDEYDGGDGDDDDDAAVPLPRFHCGDMLKAQLRHTRLLVLTSQCWDASLIRQVYEKVRARVHARSVRFLL
jgi:hypothetical protein